MSAPKALVQINGTVTEITTQGLNIGSVAGDIGSPANGDVWYNSVAGKFRKQEGSVTGDLSPDITNYVNKTVTNTYTAGARQVFRGDATNAGLNFGGGLTVNPSTLVVGDVWYRTDENKLRYYDGTTVRALVGEALAQTLTNKTLTDPFINRIIGGTGTTSSLTYQTTSGVGTTGADHIFKVGNNGGTEAMRILNNGNIGINGTSTGSLFQINNNSLGAIPADTSGLHLINSTAADATTQQASPVIRWTGAGWKSNATAASQTVDYRAFATAQTGSGATLGIWKLQSQINGGGWVDALSYTTNGSVLTASTFIGAHNGVIQTTGTQTSSNLFSGAVAGTVNSLSQLQLFGSTNISSRMFSRGSGSQLPGAGISSIGYLIGTQDNTMSSSGTHPLFAQMAIKPMTITTAAGTVTTTATLYLEDAATAVTGAATNYNLWAAGSGINRFDGRIQFDATNTAGGTTGNRTINKPSGSVNIAAGGTTITITNSLITTSSKLSVNVATNDATAYVKNYVCSAGSAIITLGAAATAETKIDFIVFN